MAEARQPAAGGASPAGRRSRERTWTRRRVARLKERWIAGATAQRISDELGGGISRSAVMGKVFRLGIGELSPRGGVRILRSAGPADNPRSATHLTARELKLHRAFMMRICVDAPVDASNPGVDANIPMAHRCGILALTPTTCRWPVGDPSSAGFFFCGDQAVRNEPYCVRHRNRARRPPVASSSARPPHSPN